MSVRRFALAFGSNLGDREGHLREGIDGLLAGGLAVEAVSSLYETPPWGVVEQPAFLNAALIAVTSIPAYDVLALAKRIEAAAGRDFEAPRWAARPIDIDLALIEGETVAQPDLMVPHVLLAERSFVLVPLAEIAGEWVHPHLGISVVAMRDARPAKERAEVRWVRGPEWAR
jgi:2-amino-4-hydroxy-6-hydroxymethyldihydropteridine diphosphokinase